MKKSLFFLFAASGVLLAEDMPAASSMTIKDIITRGGGIMYLLVALSILAVILIVYYLLTMRSKLLFPVELIEGCTDAADKRDFQEIKELCAATPCPAASIINATVERIENGKAIEAADLREAMEDEGGRQAAAIWQKLQYLMDIAVIAPMIGLLGTVWGMMISFSGLESGLNFINKADALANGVSQAMFTTFGGLIVGIMSMAFHAVLRGYVNRLIGEMEVACNRVLRALAK